MKSCEEKRIPIRLPLSESELEMICGLKVRARSDWPVSFSCHREQIWSWITWGLTPADKREYVHGKSSTLDKIPDCLQRVGQYERTGKEDGRFFIDLSGAYWKDRDLNYHQFVQWESHETLRSVLDRKKQEAEDERKQREQECRDEFIKAGLIRR